MSNMLCELLGHDYLCRRSGGPNTHFCTRCEAGHE